MGIMDQTCNTSEKSTNSRCKLRRSKSDNRMKERNEYLPEDRSRSRSSSASRHTSTNSVSSCSEVVSARGRGGSFTSAAMDALQSSEAFASTAHSMHSSNGSKRDMDMVLVRADSLTSIGSDNSDSGFRLETRTHDANNSLRGDNAAKLLSTIAGLKVRSVPIFFLLLTALLSVPNRFSFFSYPFFFLLLPALLSTPTRSSFFSYPLCYLLLPALLSIPTRSSFYSYPLCYLLLTALLSIPTRSAIYSYPLLLIYLSSLSSFFVLSIATTCVCALLYSQTYLTPLPMRSVSFVT
jgi:hypothetical protein